MHDATTIARPDQVTVHGDDIALASFLARYREPTRSGYALSLRQWFRWCYEQGITPLTAIRGHIEVWARQLEEQHGNKASTINGKLNAVCGFYKFSKVDGFITDNPAEYINRPKVPRESTRHALTRGELFRCLDVARATSPLDHALWCVLGFNGVRVSEACGLNLEDRGEAKSMPVIHINRRKANLSGPMTLAYRTAKAIDVLAGTRRSGPVFRKPRVDARLDPRSANLIVKRIAKAAGVTKTITPHSLRHTCITLALDAGVHPRDLRNTMGYSDDRPVAYYDRGRHDPARDATLMVSAYVEAA